MKIRIITSCTGEKLHSHPDQLVQDDFRHLYDTDALAAREDRLGECRVAAESMYTGQQHVRLMDGVRRFREGHGEESVDLWILSAGYGLIPAFKAIVPYECTFQGMKTKDLASWATHLQLGTSIREVFAKPADFTLVLLGDPYLRALNLGESVEYTSPTLFLTSEKAQKYIKGKGEFRVVPLSNKDTKRFSSGLVGLKGELGKRILARVAEEGDAFVDLLFNPEADVLSLLDTAAAPVTKKVKAAKANPNVDKVINIPDSWWQKKHRDRLSYFIPEWDDLVDPDYDFEADVHSGGSGDWSNEVYAHQMYHEPNYDGILISKVVAEKSAKKKERINRMGVHRFLRVPREFPIMGDCGAFGYIMNETPPYRTGDILDYYTRLDFDYGVSIDHLIVKATEAQKHFRYDLTIHNAEEFLKEHQRLGLNWTPIGAVQGWDSASYAEAARRCVAMGYRYIALGGLVRSSTVEILRVLEAVNKVVPETVKIHLFGLARLRAINEFVRLGVRSVDSASYLRRAWMGSGGQNYLTENGFYTAIRIPEGGKSFRAKRMVSEGRAGADQVEKLEKACIRAIHQFDEGHLSVEKTLDVIEDYDRLITPNRIDIRPFIRRTLEARPWKDCPCEICRRDGVDVIIFRGNNRNRRRGFHNTYIFYRILQRALAGENVSLKSEEDESQLPELPLFATVEATA
jgi:hypothetical protein